MFDLSTWIRSKLAPVPYAEDVRGLSPREMERKLRGMGFSSRAAKKFISEHKARLRG